MARLSKEELARHEGANWALNKIKAEGIQQLEEELKWRGVHGIPVHVSNADLANFSNEARENCIQTVCLLASAVLRDEFGFGKDRLNRFIERFNSKTDCLTMDFCNWYDYAQVLEEETGIHFNVPQECVVEVNSIGVQKVKKEA